MKDSAERAGSQGLLIYLAFPTTSLKNPPLICKLRGAFPLEGQTKARVSGEMDAATGL